MSTETIDEQTKVAVEFNAEKPDPIIQLLAIALELQKLCPKDQQSEKGYGNYVNLSVSGFSELSVWVAFGRDCHFKVKSLADLKAQLASYDPEAVKRKRIESLKAELAKLEETEAA